MTNSLVGILCRFRQDIVAVAWDIEGMFHRSYFRFLWCDKGDTTKEPEEYRMQVHLFGATSSPGCANLALRQAAQDGESVHLAEAATFVKENFHVDDGLVSTATIESVTFQFRIAPRDRPMTRRGILSSVSSTYDPLGFAAPFLLRGKRILQFLCKKAIDWDDPIPETMQAQWQRWVRELPLPEKMRIP